MRPVLAALYDIHGNLPALEAVLADAHEHGAGRYLLGGDYSTFGAWPAQTLARLHELQDATWIRGNWERWQADPAAIPDFAPAGAGESAVRALGADTVSQLAALPQCITLDGIVFCHASPKSDVDSFLPEPQPTDAELLDGVESDRVVFGHTHVQFRRTTDDGIELVNPGSVGLPFDGDRRAAYALIAPDGAVELLRVDYDVEHAIAALRERGDSWAEPMVGVLERASLV
jgi:diadenosine tetraphosphatase ApaH/serine/threonine PP2A family protein phosphatase